jgi:hypothetical protein
MDIKQIKPTLIDNIFSDQDYEHIYKIVNIAMDSEDKYSKFIVAGNGMKRYIFGTNSKIIKNLETKINDFFNIKVDHAGGFFARYTNELGGKPELGPHHDNAGDGYFCLTFTAQLNRNIDWKICVFDSMFDLDKNQAVIFSGNTNIHWRPDITFNDGDYLDIFVCHFYFKGDEFKLSDDNNLNMLNLAKMYTKKHKELLPKKEEKTRDQKFTGFVGTIIDKVFSDQEIEEIYKARFNDAINKKMHDGSSYVFADDSCGYITSVYPLPQSARDRLLQIVKMCVPIDVEENGIHSPRYTLESGSKPQLRPHYDVGLDRAAFTLSVQLKHTKPWALYVNDDRFDLGFNQAVIFSGTHQIHWRPDITFNKNDYYDILVCQYTEKEDPLYLSDEHRQQMKNKADLYLNKYFN